ncbi:MAG: putative Ig domain-containing protein [Methanolobus sp.]
MVIEVISVDSPPEIDPIGNKFVAEGSTLSFTIDATDVDNDPITYSAVGLPDGATLDSSSGEFSWVPGYEDADSYSVTFTVSANGLTDNETITIIVGDSDRPPVLDPIGNQAVNENELLSFSISATDPDGDSISYLIIGLPDGATFDLSTRTFSWTPDYGDAGSYSVTFTANANDLSDSETITIIVGDSDRPPVLVPIGNQVVNEDELLSFSISATDPDGDSVSYSASDVPDGATFDSSTRTFSWTPDYGDSGSYSVTFSANANGLSDSETITITVGDSDRPPVLDPIGNQAVNEDELLVLV